MAIKPIIDKVSNGLILYVISATGTSILLEINALLGIILKLTGIVSFVFYVIINHENIDKGWRKLKRKIKKRFKK